MLIVAMVTAVKVSKLRPLSWMMHHCPVAIVTAVEVSDPCPQPPQLQHEIMSCWLWLPLLESLNSSSSLSPRLRYEPLYCCYGYSCWSLWTHPSSWAWCVIDWRQWVTTQALWSFVCPKPGSATPMTLPTISTHKGNSQRTHKACRPTSPGSVSSLVCVWWPAPPFLLTGGNSRRTLRACGPTSPGSFFCFVFDDLPHHFCSQ